MPKHPESPIWSSTNALAQAGTACTIREALENALTFMEALGYQSGDIHDDLRLAIRRLGRVCKSTMDEQI